MTTQLVFEDPYEDEYESDGDAAAQEHEEDGGDGTEMDELEDQLEDGVAFAGVSRYPMRVKCATLGWHTLNQALKHENGEATTE